MMKLLDNYGVGTAIFMYGIAQSIGIVWIYGLQRFCNDIKFMLGRSVGKFWKFTWGFTAPLSLLVSCQSKYIKFHLIFPFMFLKKIIFIYGNYNIATSPPSTDSISRGIPSWGNAIGWLLACIAFMQVPFWILMTIIKQKGSLKEVTLLKYCLINLAYN